MIKLTEARFLTVQMNPIHTDSMMSCESGDANEYTLERHGDSLIVSAPLWGDKVMIVPWAQVHNASGVRVADAKPEAVRAVK